MANNIRRSWLTQRLVNRLPYWTDARRHHYSITQQFLNPPGVMFEDLFKYIIDELQNSNLTTANLDLLDIAYVVKLPEAYYFTRDESDLYSDQVVVPVVTGIIGTQEIDVQMSNTNTIKDFYYTSVPTRVLDSETYTTIGSVLAETTLADLADATINDMPVDQNNITIPNRLVITVNGCEVFVDTTRRTQSSFIMLQGVTKSGLTESELIYIRYNGVFLTRKIWKQIDRIQYFGLQPSTGTIKIDPFYFNSTREVDKYALVIDMDTEKLLYHKLSSKAFETSGPSYSTHQHLSVTANTLGALYKGEDTLQTIKEIELGYTSGTTFVNVELNDIAVQPFTGRIFGIDNTHLYIFDQYDSAPDLRGLKEDTPGAAMIVDSDFTDYIRGDTVTFRPLWRRPVERIYRNRWTIIKPDGSKYYLDIDGNTVNLDEDAWIYNKTYTEIVFGPFDSAAGEISQQQFSLNLDQRGTWLIRLEVYYVNGNKEINTLPVQVHYKTALARIALPVALQDSTGISFDADQKLWVLKGTVAHKLTLATDNMIIDFKKKTIYLHENYDSVVVEPPEDWID